MSRFLYMLATLAESGLSVFGIRVPYEQPPYTVIRTLDNQVELRRYPPRTAAETPIAKGGDSPAFGRLFRYISGTNQPGRTIAMTIPVEIAPARATDSIMRFFLPRALAANPPPPTDPLVHIVQIPAGTYGVIRFSGTLSAARRDSEAQTLRNTLQRAGVQASGPLSYFSYDPPFALPFLRRNELAVGLE